jgi:hypothetical protein
MSDNAPDSEAVARRVEADPPSFAERAGHATAPAVADQGPVALQRHAVPSGAPRRSQPGCSRAARHLGRGLEWFLE